MPLLRFVIILLALWLAVQIARYLLRRARLTRRPKPVAVGSMVRCARCGLHVPEAEAIVEDGRHYCSDAHRLEARQR